MTKKKKIILIAAAAAAVIIIAAAVLFFTLSSGNDSKSKDSVAYVDSVAVITGLGSGLGEENRFSGVVESQETTDVKKSEDKKIKQIFVSAGDTVSVGTPLFEYDTEETALTLEQERINLESIKNDITSYNNQVAELQKEKNRASASEQLSYTTQIQQAQTNAKRAEYNLKAKEAEIEKLENDMKNATVTSTMDGIVSAVNENTSYDYNGNPKPFMSIMASGEYRIKGKINEQNVWSISEGQPVIIRSRVDDTQTWTGTISKIDTSSAYKDGNSDSGVMYYGGSGEAGQTSTSYAFYVMPDNSSDFMMGQHVFIELDYGQDEEKEGLWLSSIYLVMEDNDTYIWVADSKNRLEKRKLTIGEYNSDLDEYQILEGLTAEEFIAFPGNLLKEGMDCVPNDGTHTNSSDDMPMDDDFYPEDGMPMEDGAYPEGDGSMEEGAGAEEMLPEADGPAARSLELETDMDMETDGSPAE